MDSPLFPSLTEKHNAMISYCFLGIFMLISRQEQFTGKFVRSHARYATILHIAFLALIIALVRSRNFSTVIIYDLTWVHGVLFILFFGLLFLLGNGIYSALKWQKPRISLSEFTLKNFEKEFTDEVAVEKDEKTSLILSHIPFLGIYLAAKYGGKLPQGEKFGTWLCIVAVVSTFIDPSLTFLIAIVLLSLFWIVYQAVGSANNSTIHLVGNHLIGGRMVHTYLQSLVEYAREVLQSKQKIPSWVEIQMENEGTYHEYKQTGFSPFLYIPLVNIPIIIQVRKNKEIQMQILQGLLITLLFIYALIIGSTALVVLILLAWFWGYIQTLFHKDSYIPLIGECAVMIVGIIEWKKKRSQTTEVHLQTTK